MALSDKEIKLKTTLENLEALTSAPFSIGYARIESWVINVQNPSCTVTLRLYQNKAMRDKNSTSGVPYMIGFNLTESLLTAFTKSDDRESLYPVIEYMVHYQAMDKALKAREAYGLTTGKMKLDYNEVLASLSDELKCDLRSIFYFR